MFIAFVGLFLSAFGAATLLPMQSEAVLVALLAHGEYAPWALLVVATTGNVLGSRVIHQKGSSGPCRSPQGRV
jgi:membrane protein YqaA with SNARE-associated domain